MAGLNVTGYAGLGAGGPQVPVPPQPQYQYYPYAYPPAPVPAPAVPGSTQHQNAGTETIAGKTEQSGTFKGHGTGASIQGGFTASGSIV